MREKRVILQVRSDSARFPNKAFVPIARFPSAVLAALRAANTGLPVVAATTGREVDDALALTLEDYGVRVFRGSADDVRDRFLQATSDLEGDATIVRLTADNVFPDGDFVTRLVTEFERRGPLYFGTTSQARRLPLGLGAEAFRLGALRAIAGEVDDPFDREHVTPALRQRHAVGGLDVLLGDLPEAGQLRCTLDNRADLEVLARVFEGIEDPVRVSWRLLLERLVHLGRSSAAPNDRAALSAG